MPHGGGREVDWNASKKPSRVSATVPVTAQMVNGSAANYCVDYTEYNVPIPVPGSCYDYPNSYSEWVLTSKQILPAENPNGWHGFDCTGNDPHCNDGFADNWYLSYGPTSNAIWIEVPSDKGYVQHPIKNLKTVVQYRGQGTPRAAGAGNNGASVTVGEACSITADGSPRVSDIIDQFQMGARLMQVSPWTPGIPAEKLTIRTDGSAVRKTSVRINLCNP